MKYEKPLISIIIITYNSSKYVVETLESAKAQTYQNIELIISDDSSTDNTIEICKNWIEINTERFVKTELITVKKNSGISSNCNRGLYATKGDWVKIIAGDDILLENCITDFTNYCIKNNNIKIIFGRIYYLQNKTLKEDEVNIFYSLPQNEQFIKILKGSGVPAQACFFNRITLIDLGGFDEKYKFIEDAPLWVKASEKGIYFHFINKFVAKYRLHDNNISGLNRSSNFINYKFYADQKKIILNEIIPRLKFQNLYIEIFHLYNIIIINKIIILLGNKRNIISMGLSLFILKNSYSRMVRMNKKIKSSLINQYFVKFKRQFCRNPIVL